MSVTDVLALMLAVVAVVAAASGLGLVVVGEWIFHIDSEDYWRNPGVVVGLPAAALGCSYVVVGIAEAARRAGAGGWTAWFDAAAALVGGLGMALGAVYLWLLRTRPVHVRPSRSAYDVPRYVRRDRDRTVTSWHRYPGILALVGGVALVPLYAVG